jgi:hypothetical protein
MNEVRSMPRRTRWTTFGPVAILVVIIALTSFATVPAAADANDSPQTGPWLEDGAVVNDVVRLSADDPDADPVDWFRVNLTAGASELDMLRIHLNLTKNGADQFLAWASIHDPDGALITEVRATTYTVMSTATLCHRTGAYLIQVYTYSRFDVHYRLRVEITKEANVTDGDDTLEQATFLDPPIEVSGHLHGIRDPFDHYAVNLTQDEDTYEFVEVRIAPTGIPIGRTDLDLFLLVLDDEGKPQQVSASTSNGSREVVFFAATVENTTVYIRCHAYGGNTDYSLNVTTVRVSDDGNNNILRAEDLPSGSSRNDTLNITDRLDYFKINLTGGDILWVNVSAETYDPVLRKPNFNIYLYSPLGRIINWSHSYDPEERVRLELPMEDPPAMYFVLVTYFDRTPSDGVPAYGNYTINVTIDHAPRLIGTIPLLMEEDEELTIPLASVLEDPEGRLASATPSAGDSVTAMLNGTDLVVVPAANFSGLGTFLLVARDHLRAVTLLVPVNVTPVPDAPAPVDPFPPLQLDEDGTLVVDLAELIVDGDGDALDFSLTLPEGGNLNGSTLDGAHLTVLPDPDFFGEGTLIVTAMDPGGLSDTATLVFNVTPVPDTPRVIWAEPNTTVMEDERTAEFDLAQVFSDPDGDPLTYEVQAVEGVPDAVPVTFIVLGDLLILEPEDDRSGTANLLLLAYDPEDAEASATLVITVQEVDDPPRIGSIQPEGDVTINEGETKTFIVTASDVEGNTLSYTWRFDDEVVLGEGLPRFELVTNLSSQGAHLVTLVVSDGGLETYVNWSVAINNVNRPPTLSVKRPRDGASFEKGTNIVFEAETDDPDGETLAVQWIWKDEVIGTGDVFTTSSLKTGKYTLTVRVTDPHGETSEDTVRFEVEETSGVPGISGPLVMVALVTSGVVIGVVRRIRPRR